MLPFFQENLVKIILIIAITLSIIFIPANSYAETTPQTTTTVNTKSTQSAIELKKKQDIAKWIAAVKKSDRERYIRAVLWSRFVAHIKAEQWRKFVAHIRAEKARQNRYGYVNGIQVCNGTTLPSCKIVERESGFNPTIKNPHSTASGLYQFINGTWRTCGTGYPTAMSAPVSVQVSCAKKIWNNGAGASHWRL